MSAFEDSYTHLGHRHGPPDGGRETLLLAAINIALLAEGRKSKTTEPLRNSHVRKLQVPLNHTRCAPGRGHYLAFGGFIAVFYEVGPRAIFVTY